MSKPYVRALDVLDVEAQQDAETTFRCPCGTSHSLSLDLDNDRDLARCGCGRRYKLIHHIEVKFP